MEYTPDTPPLYSFMGTDGEYYEIGPTPLSFEKKMEAFCQAKKQLTAEEIVGWIWEHVRVVEGQRDITQDQLWDLLFAEDVPNILNMLVLRWADAKESQKASYELLASMTQEVNEDRTEKKGRKPAQRTRKPKPAK